MYKKCEKCEKQHIFYTYDTHTVNVCMKNLQVFGKEAHWKNHLGSSWARYSGTHHDCHSLSRSFGVAVWHYQMLHLWSDSFAHVLPRKSAQVIEIDDFGFFQFLPGFAAPPPYPPPPYPPPPYGPLLYPPPLLLPIDIAGPGRARILNHDCTPGYWWNKVGSKYSVWHGLHKYIYIYIIFF